MSAADPVPYERLGLPVLSDAIHGARADSWLNLWKGSYHLRLPSSERERMDAFRLRFLVFNLELNEGLDAAYTTGHDVDEFDAIFDHLIVEHVPTRKIVGTYRLQTAATARMHAGFYSEREFDLSPYKQL